MRAALALVVLLLAACSDPAPVPEVEGPAAGAGTPTGAGPDAGLPPGPAAGPGPVRGVGAATGGLAGKGSGGPGRAAVSREACVDAWLAARQLNAFGDPRGTMYTGGTPLFDEATGTRRERLPYVLDKHPELARACP